MLRRIHAVSEMLESEMTSTTKLDPTTATPEEMELWLAGLEMKCPCGGAWNNPITCPRCNGSGRVPRFGSV